MALDLIFKLAAMARTGGDDDALAFSLWAHHDIIWGPGTAGERVALTGELVELAERADDAEQAHFAAALRWVAMIEQGDPRYLDRFNDYLAKGKGNELRHLDLTASMDESIVAALTGRFERAEQLVEQLVGRLSEELSEQSDGRRREPHHEHFRYMLWHHHWALLTLQGRYDELDDVLQRLRDSPHLYAGLPAALTALHRGDLDAALRHYADGEPRDRVIEPLWLRFQAEVAAATHDPELCARARAALLPHRGRWAVSLFGWDVSGPFDLWLALVDAAEERWSEAIEEATAAYRSADRMRARPWSVVARSYLADVLLARGADGDVA
ncbi:ATPase, partial [Nonomuraea sp. NN258]|nr:ATPase [Nonomuraea antri]